MSPAPNLALRPPAYHARRPPAPVHPQQHTRLSQPSNIQSSPERTRTRERSQTYSANHSHHELLLLLLVQFALESFESDFW